MSEEEQAPLLGYQSSSFQSIQQPTHASNEAAVQQPISPSNYGAVVADSAPVTTSSASKSRIASLFANGLRGHLLHILASLINMGAVFSFVIAITTQNWLKTSLPGAGQVHWGLWQVCCSTVTFSYSCHAYTSASTIESTCFLQIPHKTIRTMQFTEALVAFNFLLLVCACTANCYACIQPRRWKTAGIILNAFTLILSTIIVLVVTVTLKPSFSLKSLSTTSQSISWSFGLAILTIFLSAISFGLAILHRKFATSFLEASFDAWSEAAKTSKLHPLFSRLPIYLALIFSSTANVVSSSYFGFNPIIFALTFIALLDKPNINLQFATLWVLKLSTLVDIGTSSIYGPEVVHGDPDGERFSFAVNLLANALKVPIAIIFYVEYRHNKKLFSNGIISAERKRLTPGHSSGEPITQGQATEREPSRTVSLSEKSGRQSDACEVLLLTNDSPSSTQQSSTGMNPMQSGKTFIECEANEVRSSAVQRTEPEPQDIGIAQQPFMPQSGAITQNELVTLNIQEISTNTSTMPIHSQKMATNTSLIGFSTSVPSNEANIHEEFNTNLHCVHSPNHAQPQPFQLSNSGGDHLRYDQTQELPNTTTQIFEDNDPIFAALQVKPGSTSVSSTIAARKAARASRRMAKTNQQAEQDQMERELIQEDLKRSKELIEQQMAQRKAVLAAKQQEEENAARLKPQVPVDQAATTSDGSAPSGPDSVVAVAIPIMDSHDVVLPDNTSSNNGNVDAVAPSARHPITTQEPSMTVLSPLPKRRRRALSMSIAEEPAIVPKIDEQAESDVDDASSQAVEPHNITNPLPSLKRSVSIDPKAKTRSVPSRRVFELRHTSRRAQEDSTSACMCDICGKQYADKITWELHQRSSHGKLRSRSSSTVSLNKVAED